MCWAWYWPRSGLLCPTSPPATGTRGSRRRESLCSDSCAALLPKKMASPQAAQILPFLSSFPSAVHPTSGFGIPGDTRADEFTARCRLLECTAVHLIQSTRNRRARPHPGPRTPHDVTSSCEEPAKQPPRPPASGWKEQGGQKVRLPDGDPGSTGSVWTASDCNHPGKDPHRPGCRAATPRAGDSEGLAGNLRVLRPRLMSPPAPQHLCALLHPEQAGCTLSGGPDRDLPLRSSLSRVSTELCYLATGPAALGGSVCLRVRLSCRASRTGLLCWPGSQTRGQGGLRAFTRDSQRPWPGPGPSAP